MAANPNTAEQAAVDEQHDKHFSVKSNDTLAELDKNKTGHIDATDVRIAIHQMRLMRKALVFMSIFSIVLVLGMFAASYMAIQLAKDMSVQTGRLVDSNGHGVSTVQQVDSVVGISKASRRLSDSKVSLSEYEGVLNIPDTHFQQTMDGFLQGKTEWVASLPDGSRRKVDILGSEGNFAWGLAGSWPSLFEWSSSCPGGGTAECVIHYNAVTEVRGAGSQRLLKSRADIGVGEEGEDMQRVLQGIKYPHYY